MGRLGSGDLVIGRPRLFAVYLRQSCSQGAQQSSMVCGNLQGLSAAPQGPDTRHLLTDRRMVGTGPGRVQPWFRRDLAVPARPFGPVPALRTPHQARSRLTAGFGSDFREIGDHEEQVFYFIEQSQTVVSDLFIFVHDHYRVKETIYRGGERFQGFKRF